MSAQLQRTAHEQAMQRVVKEYLETHPDFLDRHPELLVRLELSHGVIGAVSLIERQVRTLRRQADRYRHKLHSLLQVAEENEEINRRLHRLTVSVIGAADFDDLAAMLQDELHYDFDAEEVELRLFRGPSGEAHGEALPLFRDFLELGKPQCGRMRPSQLDFLFTGRAHQIRSTVLIPLKGEGLSGVLGCASRNEHRFHAGMGTDYLARLGEIISRRMEQFCAPAP